MDENSDNDNEKSKQTDFSAEILSQKSLSRKQYKGKSAETRLNVGSITSGKLAERLSVSFDNRNLRRGSSKFSTRTSVPELKLGLGRGSSFKQIIHRETSVAGGSTTASSNITEDTESSICDSENAYEYLKKQGKRNEKFYLKKTNEATDFGIDVSPKKNKTQIIAPGWIGRSAFSENTFSGNVDFSSKVSSKGSPLSEVKLPIIRQPTLDPDFIMTKPSFPHCRSIRFQPGEEIKFKVSKNSKTDYEERELNVISSSDVNTRFSSMTYFLKNWTKKLDLSQISKKEKNTDADKIHYVDADVMPEEDLEIKKYYRNVVTYILFLIFLSIFALAMVSSNMYYFTNITQKLFLDTPLFRYNTNYTNVTLINVPFGKIISAVKTLRTSNNIGDFWMFAESVMIELFHWNYFRPEENEPLTQLVQDERKMIFENQILGVPRMRQVRVRNDSCDIHPDVARFFKSCYYFYSLFSEETRPIRFNMESLRSASAWVYTEAKTLGTSFYWGEISLYGGGGYYVDLGLTKEETRAIVNELKDNFWVARPTRAIFIDFIIYNANVNYFGICKLVLEFPPMGGMIPKADFQSLKLIRYLRPEDFFVLGVEFVYVLFCFYYTIRIIRSIARDGRIFFFIFWNYIDLAILFLSYLYMIVGIVLFLHVEALLDELKESDGKYVEFETVKHLQVTFNNIIAFLIFVAYTKLYKYLNYNTIMLELKATLSRSFKDILGFFPMFLTMFFTFAIVGFLFFGSMVKDYSTIPASMMSLLQTFVGEFKYHQIQEANRVIGPIFYVAFLFFIIFISLNVFIAIINDAYAMVKSKYHYHEPKTGKYFKRAVLNLAQFFCCGLDKKIERRPKLERKLAYETIRQHLKKLGFSDIEIRVFFSKYNININNALSEKVRKKLIEDLELKKITFNETAEQFRVKALRRKVEALVERIDEIEASLKPVIDKVDVILHRK